MVTPETLQKWTLFSLDYVIIRWKTQLLKEIICVSTQSKKSLLLENRGLKAESWYLDPNLFPPSTWLNSYNLTAMCQLFWQGMVTHPLNLSTPPFCLNWSASFGFYTLDCKKVKKSLMNQFDKHPVCFSITKIQI